MNTIGLLIVWTAVQVSVFCLAGIALYFLARRHNPAAGAWAAGTILVGTIAILALGVSPWPRWWRLSDEDSPPSSPADSRHVAGELRGDDAAAPLDLSAFGQGLVARDRTSVDADRDAAATASSADRVGWRERWASLREALRASSTTPAGTQWRWPAWLAVSALAGCGIGLFRLLAGVAALGGYRRMTLRLTDPGLIHVLDQLRLELGCARSIELRETTAACSPSTVGWRRPIVILPRDWRQWSPDERRAILAHEVAHVARGDFAIWLVAQLGVALHFYNPLVHWLAGRLRLEQEMAADLCGAELAGGRRIYLTTLAQLALDQNGSRVAWAARPFLPTRGTLMRRIEMLHHQNIAPSASLSTARRTILSLAIVVAVAVVSGVRGPAAAGPPEQAAAIKDGAQQINLDYVPNDALLVMALRPAELAKLKCLESLKKAIDGAGLLEQLGVPLEDFEEFKFVVSGKAVEPTAQERPWNLMMLRSYKPNDWAKLAAAVVGSTNKAVVQGQEYYRSKQNRPGGFTAYWLPDDRTIVLTSAEKIGETFSLRGPVNQPDWADKWRQIAGNPASMMVKPAVFQTFVRDAFRDQADAQPTIADHADFALFKAAESSGALAVSGIGYCRSPDSAQTMADLARRSLEAMKKELTTFVKSGPAAQAFAASGIPQIMLQLVDATTIDSSGATVVSQTTIRPDIVWLGRQLIKTAVPPPAVAARNRSTNKMKQIGIALLNYENVNKHFPPAVVLGPDGKTPHSWRVELLTYLDKKDLYDRYKMDEPWDSEHNRKLIAEGAELFSDPGDPANDHCSYFLLVGPGTVFDPNQPPTKIRNITDGTSKTIGVVEARRAVPWTKPEDIDYDPDKPLPKLGGLFKEGYNAGFMDASVHFLPYDVDEPTLRALITRAGREPVPIPNPPEN